MDENETHGGQTAMERLCRELMENVNDYGWCRDHVPGVIEDIGDWEMWDYGKAIAAAKADILRRIEAARAEVEGWKAKAAELDALCLVLGTDDGDEALMVARELIEEHYELKELREACRIMPEGVSWPRYSDGGPVRMGEPFVAWDGQESKVRFVTLYAPGQDAAWSINAGSCHNLFGGRDAEHQMHGLRIKRQAPKAVGADGREVKPGDTVWLAPKHREMAWSTGSSHNLHYVSESEEMTVSRVKNGRDCVVAWMEGEESRWCPASWLTHERPDSWERLREDVRKDYTAYWGCIGFCCDKCPALVDGKKPNERYDTAGCHTAEQLDILARAERLAGVRVDG